MPFFESTPNSQVAMFIERATSQGVPANEITLHLEICDLINETKEGHKNAAAALKKKLSPKLDAATHLKALILLETTVKNCGKRYHLQVTSKEFVNALLKLINKSTTSVVREKALGLIQQWADAFRSDPNMRYISNVYQDLVLKGTEFPAQNLDEMAPVITPDVSVRPESQQQQSGSQVTDSQPHNAGQDTSIDADVQAVSQAVTDEMLARQLQEQLAMEEAQARQQQASQHRSRSRSQQQQGRGPQPQHGLAGNVAQGGRVRVSGQQVMKLRQELVVVNNNCEMLHQMLAALEPEEHLENSDVIQELYVATKQMQSRLIDLIGQLENEDLLGECLQANDKISTALEHYSDIEERQQRRGQSPQIQQQEQQQQQQEQYQAPLNATPIHPTTQHVQPSVSPAETSDPFSDSSGQQQSHYDGEQGYGVPASLQPNYGDVSSDPFSPLDAFSSPSPPPPATAQTAAASHINSSSGVQHTVVDDPFGVPEPLEVDDAAVVSTQSPHVFSLGGVTVDDASTDEHLYDDFDPFKQHSGSMQESRKATEYVVPESEDDMMTFSSALHGPPINQFDDLDEPDSMDFQPLTHDESSSDTINTSRRTEQVRSVDTRRKMQLEKHENELFGL